MSYRKPLTPDDDRHGTYAGVQAHRKQGIALCDACIAQRRVYQKRLDFDHDRGMKRRVTRTAVAQHVETLHMAHGLSYAAIARLAGLSRGTVARAARPHADRQPMTTATALRLLSLHPDASTPGRMTSGYRPRIGVTRRLQALVAMGWPMFELADRMGINRQNLCGLAHGGYTRAGRPPQCYVRAGTWQTVEKVYAELHMTAGPSARARKRAEKYGWPPPLAWDDIDDPDELPRLNPQRMTNETLLDDAVIQRLLLGERVPATKAEKCEAMRQWLQMGGSEASLCARHGWHDGRYKDQGVA